MYSNNFDSLLNYIWHHEWADVERRIVEHPEELETEDKSLYALHWACANMAPSQTLTKLLSYDVDGRNCRRIDAGGYTPLAHLLSFSADTTPIEVEAVKVIVQWSPECTSIPDRYGRTTLHHICERGVRNQPQTKIEIAQILLQVDPALALAKDLKGNTAIDFLSKAHGIEVDDSIDVADTLGFFWTMVETIVSATATTTTETTPTRVQIENDGSLLHKLVSYPECRDSILECAIRWNTQLWATRDSLGNTPLHHAIWYGKDSSIIAVLLKHRPEHVQVMNMNGLLPIQLASQWSSSLEPVLQRHPQALESSGVHEVHYPRIMANTKTPYTIFELLKLKPNLFP